MRDNYGDFLVEIPHRSLSLRNFPRRDIRRFHAQVPMYMDMDRLALYYPARRCRLVESRTMSDGYSGSDLSLAATPGKNGRSGLFKTRDPLAVVPCLLRHWILYILIFLLTIKSCSENPFTTHHPSVVVGVFKSAS